MSINIHILDSIMSISDNKQNTLLYFLDDSIKNKLNKFNLILDNKYYLNDKIILIKKSTLDIEIIGKIIYINDIIGIFNNNRTLNYNPSNYYIFVKSFNKNNNNLKYFEELLNKLS